MSKTKENLRASKIIANAALAIAIVFGSAAAVAGANCGNNAEQRVDIVDSVIRQN